MYMARWLVLASIAALVPLALALAQEAEPPQAAGDAGPSADPAVDDSSTDGGANKPANAAARRREGLLLLEQAERKLDDGKVDEARQLARRAQKLYPESRAIRALLSQMPGPSRSPQHRNELTARAHLVAALNRARQLMDQRRYPEAVDLLEGITEAAALFPDAATVESYRQQAEQLLEGYRRAVARRLIPTPVGGPPSKPETADQQPAALAMPPQNVRRLVRLSPRDVPYWYTDLKTRLSRPMTVNYLAAPLGQVLEDIVQETGVEIALDSAVERAGLAARSAIDLRITAVPAETILYLATLLSRTEYVLFENRVVITTPDKALDYVERLPDVLTGHWLAQRTLFPDLYGSAAPQPEAPVSREVLLQEELTLQPYLRSKQDLLADIAGLLGQPVPSTASHEGNE